MSTCKHLLVTLLALAALPQGAAAGLRQLTDDHCRNTETCYYCVAFDTTVDDVGITQLTITDFIKRPEAGCVGSYKRVSGNPNAFNFDDFLLAELAETRIDIDIVIGDSAFMAFTDDSPGIHDCAGLTSITMNSVTKIGDGAFWDCTGLTSVQMASVKEIGHGAFATCTALASVKMNSVTEIGALAFMSCSALATVAMHSVETIKDRAFYDCTNLKSVEMNSVTEIGIEAFYGCKELASVEMPSVETIGNGAFWNTGLGRPTSTVAMLVSGDTACGLPPLQGKCSAPH